MRSSKRSTRALRAAVMTATAYPTPSITAHETSYPPTATQPSGVTSLPTQPALLTTPFHNAVFPTADDLPTIWRSPRAPHAPQAPGEAPPAVASPVQREIGEQLRDHIEVIRAVTQRLEECLCVVAPSGRIAFANPAFLAMSGWAERVLLDAHVGAVFCEGDVCPPVAAHGAPLSAPDVAAVAAPFLSALANQATSDDDADGDTNHAVAADAADFSDAADALSMLSAFLAPAASALEKPAKVAADPTADVVSFADWTAGALGVGDDAATDGEHSGGWAQRLAGAQTLRRGDGSTLAVHCETSAIRRRGRIIGCALTIRRAADADARARYATAGADTSEPALTAPHTSPDTAHDGDTTAQMRRRLWRQLEQQQAEFLSVASHELKTPLTTLKLLAQMTVRRLRDGSSPREREHAAHMEAAIIRMERLINDLLDVSRIQSGRLALRPERCDLTRLCRETVTAEAAASGRDILLRAPLRPIYVQADAERIAQVVIYLLTNALKYSQSTSPAPTVRLRRVGGEASVAVQDDGSGIPPEALPHIFERFYRAPGAQTQSGSSVGLGLGLYITREIIERHGGRIWVESALGKGSRFCFTLPLSAKSPARRPRLS